MKSYLSLIPISARVRRRQNRMTIWCIIISVLLVTAVFSVADMMIRSESLMLMEKHGSWHIRLEQISRAVGEEISLRPDVTAVGWSEDFNTDASQPYGIGGKKAALYGTDETYMTRLTNGLEQGSFPKNDQEILLSSNAKTAFDVQIGDSLTLQTPGGDFSFTVSGFGSDDKELYEGQVYMIGVYMKQNAFDEIKEKNGITGTPDCFVQFKNASQAAKAIPELSGQYGLPDNAVSENLAVMGISGQSSNESMAGFYGIAAVMFVLVLMAGVLMISGSMNSSVVRRTQFFGMLRCIGASRRQIIQFVRMEALNWCKTAVPAGLLLGTAVSWGICAMLHYGVGGEFRSTPIFAVSPAGLISGTAVGIAAVLLAARSPAKYAAKVSPMAAASGSVQNIPAARHKARLSFGRIERTLGFHHAVASKKNWFLMTASFALCMIMLFSFSIALDMAYALLPSLRSWQPDISASGYGNELVLGRELKEEISRIPGVEHVFGCVYMDHIPAECSRESVRSVNMVSYDDYMLECAKESVVEGDFSKIRADGDGVMTIYSKDNPLRVGDKIRIGETELEIVCALSDGLFADDLIVVCPEKTFARVMGETDYGLIGIQLGKSADEETVREISSLIPEEAVFSDERENNKSSNATYYATRIVAYGFLAIIGMITVFNITNSISMSVSARIGQYGVMRAIGMDAGQLTGMIAFEAFTYAASGMLAGCAVGLPLSHAMYVELITKHFGYAWSVPVRLLGIILVFVVLSAAAAVYAPAKRVCSMAITDTINEI